MAKPKWLKDHEEHERRMKNANMCHDCESYGDVVKTTKHKGKELVNVHGCVVHQGCLNTRYSLACEDFKRK